MTPGEKEPVDEGFTVRVADITGILQQDGDKSEQEETEETHEHQGQLKVVAD